MKNHTLLYHIQTPQLNLFHLKFITTSSYVNSNYKSFSSSYGKIFSKPIAADVKYSSFKTEDLLPLEDGVLFSGPVHSSCLYKSIYDVAKYRGKIPHLNYREKSRFNKKCVSVWTKTFVFQKQQNLLNVSGYRCFTSFVILWARMSLTACVVFCLVMIFLLKLLGLKIYFQSTSG